ncbi:MAG: transcriptional repressor [Candidatus Aegiribacteria sp.]|nr:transcriptional repressor [Candidatus Aegiribacteria sp.]MBD3295672.1 transcriptional repressor [Candidatus Fermentibacteria bacterium]
MKRNEKELEPLREALRKKGLKVTPQRMAVYLAMVNSHGHPSVSDIHETVSRRLPTISLDTVYRTLWKLSELGLVSPVTSSGDGLRFDSRIEHHHHFVCARCGRTLDFESEELDKVAVPDEAGALGKVWDAHIEVRGICSECQKKRDS